MELFFHPDLTETHTEVTLIDEEAKHIVRSLRKIEGDTLQICNGKGTLFTTKIIESNAKRCRVQVIGYEHTKPIAPHVHLAVSPTKNDARIEWFLEKAAELGINEISFLVCSRTEKPFIKIARYQNIVASAMKQSGQTYLTQINEPRKFSEFVAQNFDAQKRIAHCLPSQKAALLQNTDATQNSLLLIGPEGDFTAAELGLATECGYLPVGLGGTRLRTETAALVGCTLLRLGVL